MPPDRCSVHFPHRAGTPSPPAPVHAQPPPGPHPLPARCGPLGAPTWPQRAGSGGALSASPASPSRASLTAVHCGTHLGTWPLSTRPCCPHSPLTRCSSHAHPSPGHAGPPTSRPSAARGASWTVGDGDGLRCCSPPWPPGGSTGTRTPACGWGCREPQVLEQVGGAVRNQPANG